MDRVSDAATVKRVIARALLGESRAERMGTIDLLPHQIEAVDRVRNALAYYGGALLADHVGLGKTYVALAVARDYQRRLVVAPTSLASMWEDASGRAQVAVDFVSFDQLSRGRDFERPNDLVIVDEAHHARNAATRRYAALARATIGARVLLLSATPLHNRARDLHALLGLFLGECAARLSSHDIAGCIVRRTASELASARLPTLGALSWVDLPDADAVLEALLAIPPPCAPRDGGVAEALLRLSLVRQWISSDAALRATLRRRLTRAHALTHALQHGRHPTKRELAAWIADDAGVQLAFPELMAAGIAADVAAALTVIDCHVAGVRRALHTLEAHPRDAHRADALRSLVARHADARVVAFTQYAATATGLAGQLRDVPGVVLNTAHGTRSSAGALSRREVLQQLERGDRSRNSVFDVRLLISTDLLSEGVNLHAASVIVHLDLPWTPARLEQRVGRVRRLGAKHEIVLAYAFAPAARSERVVGVLRALEEKAALAERAVGSIDIGTLLARSPFHGPEPTQATPTATPSQVERLRATLRAWLVGAEPADETRSVTDGPVTAWILSSVRRTPAFLALVRDGGVVRLVGADGGTMSADPVFTGALADAVSAGVEVVRTERLTSHDLETNVRAVRHWLAGRDAERALATSPALAALSSAHSFALRAIDRALASMPRARRRSSLVLATRAREAVISARGAGAERVLRERVRELPPDPERTLEVVLRACESLVVARAATDIAGSRLVALLSILPDAG
jgi:superfamily II DNA or RNA helicase